MVSDDLEKEFEQCRLTAYPDPGTGGEPWTIGWGHTGGVKKGDTCTQEQADTWLLEDLQTAIDAVESGVTSQLTDKEKSALVDLVYNIGEGNFNRSTLLKLLNAGDYEGAVRQFAVWNKAAGKVLAGLVRRRAAEAALFKQDMA